MMLLGGLFLCSCVVLVAGGRSPNAAYIDQLIKTSAFGARISDNVFEDARLDVPDLVKKYNYPLEEHFVTTEDGYILGMHRIPHGRDAHNAPGDRPVVFLMHGFPTSSADHIIMGPGTAFAYILAEEGFDVWLGNSRGNYYSRRHITLNPDALFNTEFWDFSWDEIGNKDLPAMIDYALEYTGKSKLHYVGFSQGTTVFFVMASLRPDYNQKILSMHAMAPVAYLAHNKNPVFNAIAPYSKDLAALADLIGIGELLPNSKLIRWFGETFCKDGAVLQPFCSNIIFMFAGKNEDQHNATMIPVIMGHNPAGASARQLAHFGQGIADKDFRRYDYGIVKNLQKYGTLFPPKYDLFKITTPVFLYYAKNDPLADLEDVNRLHNELGNPIVKFQVAQETFSHADFMWGIDAKTYVYDTVISYIRIMEALS